MRDVIFVSLENWDGVWRRNQFLCNEWMLRFPEMRLLFVGRSKDVSHAVRSCSTEGLRRPLLEFSSEYKGLAILNPVKLFPNSLGSGRRLNLWMLQSQIRIASRRAGLRSPLLWINDHSAGPLVGGLGERAVVYDVTDDWTLMPAIPEDERQRIRKADAHLCGKADLVVVCSQALERSRRYHSRKLVTVPNGVDAAHYRSCLSNERDQGGPPVFGYIGTLHGDRIDIDLVMELARAKPEARVVLCGPDFLNPLDRKKLLSVPNIDLREQVDYREVPNVIAGFDVCILPHRCTPFTESLNPIKLWEYLASGKPVAATPVAGFRERAHLCHLGSGIAGFLQACERALSENSAGSAARIREAEANSWKARSEQLLEVFRQEGWLGRPIPRPPRRRESATRGSEGDQMVFEKGNENSVGVNKVRGGEKKLCETPV
jgi:teichuronic acid biosynthesis glycosyltransferase TuaH